MTRSCPCFFLVLALSLTSPLPGQVAQPVDACLGPETLMYLEVAGTAEIESLLADTELLELWQEEEMQDFVKPALTGIREDLSYLLRNSPESVRKRVAEGAGIGRITFSMVHLDFSADDGDDAPEFEMVMTAQAADAETLFREFEKYLLKEKPDEARVSTVAGRPALERNPEEEADTTYRAVLDGDRLVWQVKSGDRAFGEFFERSDGGLAAVADYQTVRRAVGTEQPLAFCYLKFADGLLDMFAKTGTAVASEERAEAMSRVLKESPTASSIRAIGYAIGADGRPLRDRVYVLAPGNRSGWGKTGTVGDAVPRHAMLADPDSDLFLTLWFDLADTIERNDKEAERVRGIFEDCGVEVDEEDDLSAQSQAIEAIEKASGIDVRKELVPLLGNHCSVFMSVPSGGLTIPDFGLVLDLADPAGFDAILARLVAADDQFEEVNFLEQDYQGNKLVTVKLVGAGVPVLPTLCRLENQLLVCTTGPALKDLLRSIAANDSLAVAERFQEFMQNHRSEASTLLWCDMGTTFQYLYGFVGLALSGARMAGAELGERFDASLLPTGDLLAEHLGIGTFVATEDQQGFTYEGLSTLGNPLLGTLSGVIGIASLMGVSELTRNGANDARQEQSEENLCELARSMQAYRGSVGAGSYPTNLVKLVERGLLADRARLVDPADPKPKMSKLGTGERIPVSYAIGTTDLLPESERCLLFEGRISIESLYEEQQGEKKPTSATIVYTRGAWHDHWNGKARLVIVLGQDGETVHSISEKDWAK